MEFGAGKSSHRGFWRTFPRLLYATVTSAAEKSISVSVFGSRQLSDPLSSWASDNEKTTHDHRTRRRSMDVPSVAMYEHESLSIMLFHKRAYQKANPSLT
jgi:hypothetical protein